MGLKRQKFDYDLVVIGSGAGGSSAAVLAARAGLSTAIIEAGTFGGDALNYSDVPISALAEASQLYDAARRGVRFGLTSAALRHNFPSLMGWKDTAIKRTGASGSRRFYESMGIKTYTGLAHFTSPHEISVNRQHLSAARFLIATGSTAAAADIKNLDRVSYLTPKSCLNLTRLPRHLFVVGGGATGTELAQIFATLGTKVLIADLTSRLLPKEDEEVGQAFGQIYNDNYGIKVLTHTKVVAVASDSAGKKITFLRGGEEKSVRIDEILLATGACPATDLGLENAGVEYGPGGIIVNNFLQTSAKHIFAAGDVIGGDSSTQLATYQSQIAGSNLVDRVKYAVDYAGFARLVGTFPAVASVGLREDDTIRRDIKIKKAVVPLSQIARSNTADFRDGFVKLIADRSDKVLGATIVSPEAGSLISEISLAIKCGLDAETLAALPRPFLSWSEAIKLAASKLA